MCSLNTMCATHTGPPPEASPPQQLDPSWRCCHQHKASLSPSLAWSPPLPLVPSPSTAPTATRTEATPEVLVLAGGVGRGRGPKSMGAAQSPSASLLTPPPLPCGLCCQPAHGRRPLCLHSCPGPLAPGTSADFYTPTHARLGAPILGPSKPLSPPTPETRLGWLTAASTWLRPQHLVDAQ